jgi:xanthine dehydrogenase accessory factor
MEVDVFNELQRLRRLGQKAALATIVRIKGIGPSFRTSKMLIRDDGSRMGSVGDDSIEAEVWSAAQQVIHEEKSRLLKFDRLEVFIEPILPTPQIIVFGAGHIATQVSQIATIAGFSATIVDNLQQYANKERFPEAAKIYSDSFDRAFEEIEPDENTYIIIITRDNQQDKSVLRWAVQTDARYIGMIGSRWKTQAIAQELEEEGISRQRLERVNMPIGLDIGAVLPEEIAVAIVAEVIHNRRAGFKHPLSKKLYKNAANR